jgi:uncharacterized membrane protein YecN with MAPEG domain
MTVLPITTLVAALCGVLYVFLAARVIQKRAVHNIELGDGNDGDMFVRIRSHANFSEYVPLILILMALVESADGSNLWLKVAGVALIISRIFHAFGMPKKAPNFFRASGAITTLFLIVALSVYALYLVW